MNASCARSIPVEYLAYKITILKKTLLTVLAVSAAALFFSRKFSLGFFVGGAIAMANFSLFAKYIEEMRNLTLRAAKKYIMARFLLIYLVMAAALFVAASKGMLVFAATALGLLAVKASIFLDGVLGKNVKPG